MSNPFDIMVVDENQVRLTSFCDSLEESSLFGNIHHVSDHQKALHKLKVVINCDAVFLFEDFELSIIANLIKAAKKTEQGAVCAFVLVIRPDQSLIEEIGNYADAGIDGFLFQPVDTGKLLSINALIRQTIMRCTAEQEKKSKYSGASQLLRKKFEKKQSSAE